MAKKFYAYFLEKENISGIVETWDECKTLVNGKKARYKSFPTRKECETWLGAGANYEKKAEIKKEIQENLPMGIYFDAGTGRGIGVEVRVTSKEGNSILHKILPQERINEFGNFLMPKGATNNFGELAGIFFALEIALKEKIFNIYGDSSLVIEYWSKGFIKKDNVTPKTYELAMKVKERREFFEAAGGKISHISGDFNPADLGFHK